MRLDLLPLLACPVCGGDLEFAALERLPGPEDDVETGRLRCKGCAAEYEISGSIPRLFPPQAQGAAVRRTARSFGWEWLRYPGSLPEDREVFLAETQIHPEDWKDKLALDAGCGMGRYAVAALELGARVVAFDLSESLTRLVDRARADSRLHLVQGDLLRPPFKKGLFDVVYSQGVIHHTRDTPGAFRALAALVRKSGWLTVWVYGTPGSWASFSTNPLRLGRERLKSVLPLVWLVVWVRMLLSDAARFFTTRLPVPLLYLLCYPLAGLGAVPLLKYLTFSVHRDFRVRLIEDFDWLAPPFQTKHTKEEVRGWFEAAGLEILRQLPHGVVPKVGMLGVRPG